MINKTATIRNTYRLSISMLLALVLVSIASCGKVATTSSKVAAIGIGTPQPGTDGRPMVIPNGHWESIVATNGTAYVGSDNGTLYALKANNGSVEWQYSAGSPIQIATVTAGNVYAYAGSSLYSLNAASGALLWHHQLSNDVTHIIVTNSIVYADSAADHNAPTVYAFNSVTGSELWHYTASTLTPGLLAVSDGNVYYMEVANITGNADETIIDLRASDGHMLWRIHLNNSDGLASGSVAEANGIVYIATLHGAVYAVRASDGALLWHVARPGQDSFPLPVFPTIVNGIVYTATQQHIYALQASNGKQVWQYTSSHAFGPTVIPFVISDGVLYTSDVYDSVFALNANNGAQLWQHSIAGIESLIVQNGQIHLFLGNAIAALSANDGSQIWQHPVANVIGGESWIQPEVVADGTVYTAGENGTVQAFQTSDGTSLWHYDIQENAVPISAPIYSASINFTATTSYTQALRLIADLGLQTYIPCLDAWQPEGIADGFQNQNHGFLVSSTPVGATNWYNRLQASPAVMGITANPVYMCPKMRPNQQPAFLPAKQAGTYVKVRFSSATSYDSALNIVNTLGFRLADPTYEQQRAQGTQPTWSSMGQEETFSKTQTLLLATTSYNALSWATQLKTSSGVMQVSNV